MALDISNLKPFDVGENTELASLISGSWSSLLGGQMDITSASGNDFSGTYTSSVSEGGFPVTGPLTGTITGGALGFVVNWSQNYSSVTSWNGLLLDAGSSMPVIYTLWQLAATPASDDQWWEAINAGTDFFLPSSS